MFPDKLMILFINIAMLQVSYVHSQFGFNDVTTKTFESMKNLTLLAFADFDLDRKTDILTLHQINDRRVEIGVVYGRDDNKPNKYQSIHTMSFTRENLTKEISVIPGDFNGDLKTDLLVCMVFSDDTVNLNLCLDSNHEGKGFNCLMLYTPNHFPISTRYLPILLDYNGDMLPDILLIEGENVTAQTLTLLLASSNGTFHDITLPDCFQQALNSDLIISYDHSSFISSGPTFHHSGPLINLITKKGIQSVPVYDGSTEPRRYTWPETDIMTHVTPISNYDYVFGYNKPNESMVVIRRIHTEYKQQNGKWISKESVQTMEMSGYALSPAHRWIRAADFNNDGVVDLVVVLYHIGSKSLQTIVLLLSDVRADTSRIPYAERILSIDGDIKQLAIYDLYNDGRLDILYVSDHGGTTQLHALQNTLSPDSNFIEFQVASGLCPSEPCEKPYTNIIGAHVNMTTTAGDGQLYTVDMIQLPQASGFSLHLPYLHVGLDKDSNYIDSVTIGLDKYGCSDGGTQPFSRSWQGLLPNSHLIIIPHPPNQTDKWSLHLYVVPSKLVLSTGLVLLGLCGFLAIIIGILHLKEKRDDREENMKDQQFHFNTM